MDLHFLSPQSEMSHHLLCNKKEEESIKTGALRTGYILICSLCYVSYLTLSSLIKSGATCTNVNKSNRNRNIGSSASSDDLNDSILGIIDKPVGFTKRGGGSNRLPKKRSLKPQATKAEILCVDLSNLPESLSLDLGVDLSGLPNSPPNTTCNKPTKKVKNLLFRRKSSEEEAKIPFC